MDMTFEFAEPQNLDEAVRAAFADAGYQPDADYTNQKTLIESGLERAEADGETESIGIWQNLMLAHKASEPRGEREIRQAVSAAGSLLAAAGLGRYAAPFNVSITVDEASGNVSVSVQRGAGGLIEQSGATGEPTILNPDSGNLSSTGL